MFTLLEMGSSIQCNTRREKKEKEESHGVRRNGQELMTNGSKSAAAGRDEGEKTFSTCRSSGPHQEDTTTIYTKGKRNTPLHFFGCRRGRMKRLEKRKADFCCSFRFFFFLFTSGAGRCDGTAAGREVQTTPHIHN